MYIILINKDISTDGIDIAEWEVHPTLTSDVLPMPDDRLKFNCWDFAGQEVIIIQKRKEDKKKHQNLYI